ncbi:MULTISPECIES: hypothetical protein [Acidiphilium]|uniref:Sulfite dehydrogenase (Cytochrome) subunit SorB n=1 Tax=Acidiphilium rubrum TaxID=526 RepID=A0A8G2CNY2_ACIRU|nr:MULTISPECIES: hypothetical protein [Acidiphilium]MCW8308740.1 sulfite--cytochrome C oxidoreductase subunit B [Acidiphilium sp. PA]SIR52252.1 sulfite dehydrogenase (cytochrome) subunit SorB [Acidiphilium rubrum]
MKIKTIALLAGGVLSISAFALAATPAPIFKSESVKIPVPGAYFQGTDAAVLNQNCAYCHSAGFVNRQPVIPQAAWTGEVTKMKKVFGAPYSTAEIPKLVDALVARQKERK